MILYDDSYFLLGKSFELDENIKINNPTLEEIFDFGEEKYFSVVLNFISKPCDFKIQLSDLGIDFETIDDFEFFGIMVKNISPDESRILFGDLDFTKLDLYIKENQEKIIKYENIIINELSYNLISEFIRKMNGLPVKKPEKYANEHVKQYIMEVERTKLRHAKKEPFKPMLIPLVSGLVNCSESSYSYSSVMQLTISQLHDAISRVNKVKNYNHVVQGIYAGTLQSDKINQDDINWLK